MSANWIRIVGQLLRKINGICRKKVGVDSGGSKGNRGIVGAVVKLRCQGDVVEVERKRFLGAIILPEKCDLRVRFVVRTNCVPTQDAIDFVVITVRSTREVAVCGGPKFTT